MKKPVLKSRKGIADIVIVLGLILLAVVIVIAVIQVFQPTMNSAITEVGKDVVNVVGAIKSPTITPATTIPTIAPSMP